MRRFVFIILVSIGFSLPATVCFGQKPADENSLDTLVFRRGLFYSFTLNGKVLSYKEVKTLLDQNPTAFKKLQASRRVEVFAVLLAVSGIILTSATTITINQGGDVNVNPYAVAGLGTLGVAALLVRVYNNHYSAAAELYNYR